MQMKKAQVIIENEDKELTFGLIVKNPWNVLWKIAIPGLFLLDKVYVPAVIVFRQIRPFYDWFQVPDKDTPTKHQTILHGESC